MQQLDSGLFFSQDPTRQTSFGCCGVSARPAHSSVGGVCHLQLTPTEGEEEEEEVQKRCSQEHQRGSKEDSSFSSR